MTLTEMQAELEAAQRSLALEQKQLADFITLGGGWAVERHTERVIIPLAQRIEALKAAIAAAAPTPTVETLIEGSTE